MRAADLSLTHLRADAEALNGLAPLPKPDDLAHRLAQNAEPEYNAVASD